MDAPPDAALPTRAALSSPLADVRARTTALCEGLSAEDLCVQSMPDASPGKWHLAHTTWFFETVVLQPHAPGYRVFDPAYAYLFNSYYEALGPRHPRPQRGLLTRPGLAEIRAYRHHVDRALQEFIASADEPRWRAAAPLLLLGLHHEQQHQELLLTDLLHLFSMNPLQPAVRPAMPPPAAPARPLQWVDGPSGIVPIGHVGEGFAFDNETARHEVLLHPYRLSDRPVNCGEMLDFIRDGGYRDPRWWLSDGWAQVQAEGWEAPLYWRDVHTDHPTVFTLAGRRPLDPHAPACHLSFYEAAAYASWAGARLPTEFEWEAAAARHPGLNGLFGQIWQWTRSSYDPYPGFRPLPGAAGEYNGKFMVGQMVLRGSSLATPPGHARASYRNFFPPAARWQFSGLRLARDA